MVLLPGKKLIFCVKGRPEGSWASVKIIFIELIPPSSILRFSSTRPAVKIKLKN